MKRHAWLFYFYVFLLIVIYIFQLFFNNFFCKFGIFLLFTVISLFLMRLKQQLTVLWAVKQRLIKAHIIASRFDFTMNFLLIGFTFAGFIYYIFDDLLLHNNNLFYLFDDLAFDVDWNLHNLLDPLDSGIIRCDYWY